MQAGKQLEHVTGGLIKAGFHEVVVNDATLSTIEKRRVENPERPLVRISSTFFYHLASDFDLVPIPELLERARLVREEQARLGRDEGSVVEYRAMKVGEQVQEYVPYFYYFRTLLRLFPFHFPFSPSLSMPYFPAPPIRLPFHFPSPLDIQTNQPTNMNTRSELKHIALMA